MIENSKIKFWSTKLYSLFINLRAYSIFHKIFCWSIIILPCWIQNFLLTSNPSMENFLIIRPIYIDIERIYQNKQKGEITLCLLFLDGSNWARAQSSGWIHQFFGISSNICINKVYCHRISRSWLFWNSFSRATMVTLTSDDLNQGWLLGYSG